MPPWPGDDARSYGHVRGKGHDRRHWSSPMTTVTITEAPLAIEDLLAVVGGARVELDDGTRARIAASRAMVDRAVADGEAIYGLTTQVGHGKDTRLTQEQIQGEQRFLVMSHSGGIGMGRAEYRGEILPGGEALHRAGIAPLVLGGKDGLALISANGVSVGQAALVASRAAAAAEAADTAAALSMEATGANTSVLRPAVGRAKPIPGQVAAADHLR